MESNASSQSQISPQETDPAVDSAEREQIRQQLSTMSFKELQKLKAKIGSKVYNETVFGAKSKKAKNSYKRANKNRPKEMSSKRPINIQKEITGITKPKVEARDPRFDPLCGTYSEKLFKSNYKFLNDVRKKERVELGKEYEKAEDEKKKKRIKLLMQRLDNQIREQEKRDREKQQEYEEKLEVKEKLKQGEKPIFKKKSEKRFEKLLNQYEELKKTNKLQKHIERRSKKLTSKDRKDKTIDFL